MYMHEDSDLVNMYVNQHKINKNYNVSVYYD